MYRIGDFWCRASGNTNVWDTSLMCEGALKTDTTTSFITLDATKDGTETAGNATTVTGAVLAFGVSIRYQASDTITTTSSTSSSSAASTASTASATSTSSATSTAAAQSSSGGLSTSAAIGVGVGVGVGGLAVLIAVVFLFWTRRGRKSKTQDVGGSGETGPETQEWLQPSNQFAQGDEAGYPAGGYAVNSNNNNIYHGQVYTDAVTPPTYKQQWPAEMPIDTRAHEVSGEPNLIEMDASNQRRYQLE